MTGEPSRSSAEPTPAAPLAAARSHSALVDGIPMRWEERGSGPPVVLVHGIPTSPALWRKVLPRVDGARLLAWEMVGYGESIPAGSGRDLSVARQADYLRRWMRQIGVDRAVLVGTTWGEAWAISSLLTGLPGSAAPAR